LFIFFLVFSSDDRSPSASTSNEKPNKTMTNNYNSNNQSKKEHILVPEDIKRADVNFLEKNIEQIRIASLRNKYDLLFFWRKSNTFDPWFYLEKVVMMKIKLFL